MLKFYFFDCKSKNSSEVCSIKKEQNENYYLSYVLQDVEKFRRAYYCQILIFLKYIAKSLCRKAEVFFWNKLKIPELKFSIN